MVLRDSIDMDATVDEQTDEADTTVESSSSSDSGSSSEDDDHEPEPSSSTSFTNRPGDGTPKPVSRPVPFGQIKQDLNELYGDDDGYESDETVIGASDSDEEHGTLNSNIPQVFIC